MTGCGYLVAGLLNGLELSQKSPFQPKAQQKLHLHLKSENTFSARYLQEFSSAGHLSTASQAQPGNGAPMEKLALDAHSKFRFCMMKVAVIF